MCNLNLKPNATVVVDDSGTESGEEVNQKILVQVQGALANLESALPALDPLRRSSVVELLTKLQTSLKLSSSSLADGNGNKPTPPPRKCWNKKATTSRQDRHTVGVSSEELQDARRWLEENGYAADAKSSAKSTAVSACSTPRSYDAGPSCTPQKTFRPVKFVPPPPKRTHYTEDYIPEPSKQSLQNNSFTCAPLQHGIVEDLDKRSKITKSTTSSRQDSTDSSSSEDVLSDDGDVRSGVSSAQRLLQIASNDHGRKFRQGKRVKLKRGGSASFSAPDEEHSSGDEYVNQSSFKGSLGGGVPPFKPKTANDKKYLALLRQQAKNDEIGSLPSAYNPLQGKLQGNNWGNRFGRIKTTFEKGETAAELPNKRIAKTFWHDICKCPSDNSIAFQSKKSTSFKPVWAGENGFSHHATKSAFKPVVQKIITPTTTDESTIYSAPTKPASSANLKLPLYNSSVTTAHRPFIYTPDRSDDDRSSSVQQQWNVGLASPGSASDLTSRSDSPSVDYDALRASTVVSQVMGSPQTASIVKGKTSHIYPSPSLQPASSCMYPSAVPACNKYLPSATTAKYQPSIPTSKCAQSSTPASMYTKQSTPASKYVQPLTPASKYTQPSTPASKYAQPSMPASKYPQPLNPVKHPSVVQVPKPPPRSPRLVPQQRSPTSSPVLMPSVLQKSESWHQMILGQSKATARSPLTPMPMSSGRKVFAPNLGFSPHTKEQIVQKQNIVRQHLRVTECSSSSVKRVSPKLVKLNDDIDKVDDTFESLFKEATKTNK